MSLIHLYTEDFLGEWSITICSKNRAICTVNLLYFIYIIEDYLLGASTS